MGEVSQLMAESPSPSRDSRITYVNNRLAALERQFLTKEGLPGRKWFRHVLQAPGLYTGYAPKTLPGIYEAIGSAEWKVAQSQIEAAAVRVKAAAAFLRNSQTEEDPVVVV